MVQYSSAYTFGLVVCRISRIFTEAERDNEKRLIRQNQDINIHCSINCFSPEPRAALQCMFRPTNVVVWIHNNSRNMDTRLHIFQIPCARLDNLRLEFSIGNESGTGELAFVGLIHHAFRIFTACDNSASIEAPQLQQAKCGVYVSTTGLAHEQSKVRRRGAVKPHITAHGS